jgi:hypothetical protein
MERCWVAETGALRAKPPGIERCWEAERALPGYTGWASRVIPAAVLTAAPTPVPCAILTTAMTPVPVQFQLPFRRPRPGPFRHPFRRAGVRDPCQSYCRTNSRADVRVPCCARA